MDKNGNGTDKYITYKSLITITGSSIGILILVLGFIMGLFSSSVNSNIESLSKTVTTNNDNLKELINNNQDYYKTIMTQHVAQPHPGAESKEDHNKDIDRIETRLNKLERK